MIVINNTFWKNVYISVPIFIIVMNLLHNVNIKKIAFDKADVELESKKINDLNEEIEELIHFFMSTDYNIVIFEDLDRMDDYKNVIKNLTHINIIINNAIHDKNKTIQFIYSISDRCFENSEIRTKFFDIIVPIKPYINEFNSKNTILKLLDDNSIKLFKSNSECIKVACNYLKNPRLVFDFVNEYTVYYNEKLNKQAKEELFYLILYKISFPNRFYKFINKTNKISVYYSDLYNTYVENQTNQKWGSLTNEIKISYIDEYIKNKKYNIIEDINEFEEKIINLNVLTNDYYRLFINRVDQFDKISINDENIVQMIKNNESIEKLKIDKESAILDKLDLTDFQKDSILNIKLLKYLVKNVKVEYVLQIFNNLNEKKLQFIVNNENNINLIKSYPSNLDKFWSLVSLDNNKLEKNIINKLLLYTFKYCNVEFIQDNKNIINYISTEKSYLKLFDENYDMLSEKFKTIDYKINFDFSKVKYTSSIMYDAFITGKIIFNYNNLCYYSKLLKLSIKEVNLISVINSVDDLLVREKYFVNINEIIEAYKDKSEIIKFTEDDLKNIISNTDITEDNINYIVSKWNHKVTNLSDYDKNVSIILMKNNKFNIIESNLLYIYENNIQYFHKNKSNIITNIIKYLTPLINNENILSYFIFDVLIDLNENELKECINALIKINLTKYIFDIINNNVQCISIENYYEILKHDENIKYILHGGQKIKIKYDKIVNKLIELELISSINRNDSYIIVYLKKKYIR